MAFSLLSSSLPSSASPALDTHCYSFFLVHGKSSTAMHRKRHNNVQRCSLLGGTLGRKEADERRTRPRLFVLCKGICQITVGYLCCSFTRQPSSAHRSGSIEACVYLFLRGCCQHFAFQTSASQKHQNKTNHQPPPMDFRNNRRCNSFFCPFFLSCANRSKLVV